MPAVQQPIIVREAIIDDTVHKLDIYNVIHSAYHGSGGWTTENDIVGVERMTVAEVEEMIMTIPQQKCTLLLAVEHAGSSNEIVVGTIKVHPLNDMDAELGLLAVRPAHQSKGIGQLLIQAALETAAKQGFHRCTFCVLENRVELLQLYSRIGFELTSELVPYYQPEILKENSHYMIFKKDLRSKPGQEQQCKSKL